MSRNRVAHPVHRAPPGADEAGPSNWSMLMTRKEWLDQAEPLKVTIDSCGTVEMEPKEFSTGTVGWYYNGKADGGKLQVQLSVYVVGSKSWQD